MASGRQANRVRTYLVEDEMRKLFESGMAFVIVAAICFASGFAGHGGWNVIMIASGVLWLVVAIGVRAKNKNKNKSGGG